MFDILLDEKKEGDDNALPFLRLWRLATRKIRYAQKDKGKGVIFNIITPDAFTLKPSHRSVSLNRLVVETEDENDDSNRNRLVMECKIQNSMSEDMASIFILNNDLHNSKLSEDPEYKELSVYFKIEKTVGGEFQNKDIEACHYDLIYLSKEGIELCLGSNEFSKDYIINTKRMISELAKIPQSSLV